MARTLGNAVFGCAGFLIAGLALVAAATSLLGTTRRSGDAPAPMARDFSQANGDRGWEIGAWGRSGIATRNLAEREQLALNPPLMAFLSSGHQWPTGTEPPQRLRFDWTDDRNALIYSGCSAEYIDPDIAHTRCRVEVNLDTGLFARMQQHYGVETSLFSMTLYDHTQEHRDASGRLMQELQSALRGHGVRWRPSESDGSGGLYGPDEEALIKSWAPHLKPLAKAVIDGWVPIRNGPQYDEDVDALTSFVQRAIPYTTGWMEPDGKERFGLRTPGLTLLMGGDCDSKCLLLATMVRAVRPEIPLLLVSMNTKDGPHSILGVGIAAGRCATTLQHAGRAFVLIESTSGFGIGSLGDDGPLDHIYDRVPVPADAREGS